MIVFAGEPSGIFIPPSSGRYFDAGSSTESLPSSCSIMIATAVIGLVIDAIQNTASVVIGSFRSTSARPWASR